MNKTTNNYVNKAQLGFSLVELMIAMVISSIVIGGVFSIFIKTKDSQRYSRAVSQVQESARFSLGYLKQDLRMIGYRGCISFDDPTVTVNVNDNEMPANFNAANNELIGYEVVANSFDDPMYGNASNIKDIIKVGTDAFNIGRMASLANAMAGNLAPNNANIEIESSPDPKISQDDIIFISDCISADIFKVTNSPSVNEGNRSIRLAHAANGNKTPQLSKIYQLDAEISKYQSRLYFIGDTTRTNHQNQPIFALYQATNTYNAAVPTFLVEELIEGVENMQLLYGEVLANNNVSYRTADAVTNMRQVISVQIGLLISSRDNVRQSSDGKTYQLPGQAIAPSAAGKSTSNSQHQRDNRLRRVVTSTIQIRNRQL